jgi:hypothetical protein
MRGAKSARNCLAMPMKKAIPAANPDSYISALTGWRRKCAKGLREAVRGATALEEVIKWGHLVYFANGPVLLIRAEDERVLFGFWRGKRLRDIEPRLKPSGKYEMATIELHDGDTIGAEAVRRLTQAAITLNQKLGDPRDAAKGSREGAKGAKHR